MIHEVIIDGVTYIPKGATFEVKKLRILRSIYDRDPDDYRYDESIARWAGTEFIHISDSMGSPENSVDNVADRIVIGLLEHEEER